MNMFAPIVTAEAVLASGNHAVARGVWEAGATIAAAYPGTPSTEILEYLSDFAELDAHWATNEKVALEVAYGASLMGARAFCAMKHVGLNVAADALMSLTLSGPVGGLVIAVADDVGLSSSQNEQDSRFWGRFGHLPVLEPCDSQEAYEMARDAFELCERFQCPVLLRLTTRVCHVKTRTVYGERQTELGSASADSGFTGDPGRMVLVPAHARNRLQVQVERDRLLAEYTEQSSLNIAKDGTGGIGFITSGPAYMHVRESFPHAPVFKLGLSYPLPFDGIRKFAAGLEQLVVVEETEPLVETELQAAGIPVLGKELLPNKGELTPEVLRPALGELIPESGDAAGPVAGAEVFARPPTMCVGCPHLGVYYCLSRFKKKAVIAGDIGCYSLGAGRPWQALDSVTCMGASIGMALGMDLARRQQGDDGADRDKAVIAVIGDSTFLHMGIQGLIDLVYKGGNVTVMLLDNSTTAMTGGQDNPGTGRDVAGLPAPRVDFAELVRALGVRPERIREVDPYEMPTLFKIIKEETKAPEPSVIITNKPCVLIDDFRRHKALAVREEACTGCTNCLQTGCPALQVTRRDTEVTKSGKRFDKAWVRIDAVACTGCGLCAETCGPGAIGEPAMAAVMA
ncbi:MAG: thiamine pyrophosphate-dependent enzyme [Alphaproteobacteria bacterium]|nr:thiamine pyrophosphate-dependent enzyme [Alphaproteobacteria bacterium]